MVSNLGVGPVRSQEAAPRRTSRSHVRTLRRVRVEHRNGLFCSIHARADDTRLHRCQRRRFHVIFEVTFGVAFESIFVDSARTYVSVRSLAHRANFTRCHSTVLDLTRRSESFAMIPRWPISAGSHLRCRHSMVVRTMQLQTRLCLQVNRQSQRKRHQCRPVQEQLFFLLFRKARPRFFKSSDIWLKKLGSAAGATLRSALGYDVCYASCW